MGRLTTEQRELFERMDLGKPRVATRGQTIRQQLNLAVDSYLHWAWLDGIDPPSEDALRGEIAACGDATVAAN